MPNKLRGTAVANLLGGVSQQPENQRFLNMAEESINAYPTFAEGLDKRPGSQFVAVGYAPAGVGSSVQVFSHVVNRDSGEKYVILLYRDGTAGISWTAKAHNAITGAAVPIYADTTGAALGTILNDYLLPATAEEQATDEKAHMRMMTVGDTTFLLNRRRITKMETGLSAAQDNLALVVVRAGAYGQRYAITLDGTTHAVNYEDVQPGITDGLTPDGSVALHSRYIGPEVILRRLLTDITGPDVSVTQVDQNTWRVRIKNSTGGTFKLSFAEFTTGAWATQTTANIAYSAAGAGATLAGNIDAALEAVYPGAAVFTVVVGPDYSAGVNETFDISVAGANAADFAVADNSLTGAGGGYSHDRVSNVAFIQKVGGGAFDIEPDDANYTRLMEVIRKDIEAFDALPLVAPDGFKVRVAGTNQETDDDYYVEFNAEDTGAFGRGIWEESIGWAVKTSVDAATMPHVLRSYVKSSVGTHPAALAIGDPYFVLEQATWDDRASGDDETNPIPATFDRRIDAMGFHRGRLILMSGENVLASEAGSPFNLFRVSTATLLETDRLDLTSQIKDASDFRAMVEHNEKAVLFTDQSQVVLDAGGSNLSPTTAGLSVAGSAVVDPDGGPVTAGPFIFAPFRRGHLNNAAWGGYSGVYQMFDTRGGDALRLEAADITEHCPRYIKGRILQMAASTTENLLAVVTEDRDFIYLYRWQDEGDRRVQSAWQKIRLATSYAETTPPRICAIAFVESTLFVTTFRDSDGMGVVIERIEFAPGSRDDDFWSKILLDNRVKQNQIAGTTVALVGSDTVVTFPAGTWKRRGDGATGIVYAVLADIAGQAGGQVYTSNAPAGGGGGTAVVTFPGVDLTAKTFYIGQKFTMRHTLSPVYLEAPAAGGQMMALIAGKTHVSRAIVDVAAAASLKCEVTRQTVGGTTATRSFLHASGAAADIAPFSGSKSVPIIAENDDYALTLVNDSPWGSRINGVEYEARYHSRGQRVA